MWKEGRQHEKNQSKLCRCVDIVLYNKKGKIWIFVELFCLSLKEKEIWLS
jgi:hypothetical protein